MNILLWILQVSLALYYLMGGIYQVTNYKMFSKGQVSMKPIVMGIGMLQALFALGLAIPKLSPVAAICVAVLTLAASIGVYKIRKVAELIWLLLPAILAFFVAYGRLVLAPF